MRRRNREKTPRPGSPVGGPARSPHLEGFVSEDLRARKSARKSSEIVTS